MLLLQNPMLEDADNTIVDYPKLVEFVRDAPWVNVKSSNVSEIPGDDDSFKEQLDSMTEKINNFPRNQSPVPVRLSLLFISYYCCFIALIVN